MGLNSERPVADYNCSQAELYSGLETVWTSQGEKEADFIAENTKYTAGLSVTRKEAVAAAKALPDGQARGANAEDLRVDLVESWDGGMGKWNSLEGYIRKAFKGEHFKPRIEEAGKLLYRSASEKDWEVVAELLQAGKNFITNHSAVLLADGGMPATFSDTYDDAKDAFDQIYSDYKAARQSQEQTDAKILANNAIYADGREMMEDGKHIFRKNAAVREKFVWERILSLLTPEQGGTGISAVREADVPAPGIFNIPVDTLLTTPLTKVRSQITMGPIRLYTSATPGEAPNESTVFWDLAAGSDILKTLDEFKALVGWTPATPYLNAQNIGMSVAHFKLTFTNLEEEE